MKRTAGECQNQKDCQGVPQQKELPGIATIKMTARELNNQTDSKELPGCATLKMTSRECHK